MAVKKLLHGSAAETETAFYEALNRADLESLMALWAEEEEITCIHPGAPRLVGHAAIRASWAAIFERGAIRVRPVQLYSTHNLMTAVHSIIEEIQRRQDDDHEIHVLCTNVYLNTPLGWRIVTHHASIAA
jgi:ketosteroid isomerase-like protein